jgi:2'-5' RNA ligase
MEASEVTVNEDGKVGFTNGRHRYAWLRDQGLTSIPVSMDPESVKNAKKHGYLAAVKLAWDESQHPRDTHGQFSDVPAEPGTTPIPPGKIRGYHYTGDMDAVEKEGLSITKAKGAGYGEPNAIWFSTAKPHDFKDYVEVFLDPDEISGRGPLFSREDKTSPDALARIAEFNRGDHDYMSNVQEIPPSRFVTTSRPWHEKYRYIAKASNAQLQAEILAGEHDALLDTPDYGPAIRKFKEKHAQKSEHSYGNTQIQIDPASSAAASLNAARATIADADCMADGKDVDPNHVTVRYGLENDDLDGLRAYLSTLAPFEARVLRVELFPASEHSDGAVPVVALIASPELRQIEKEIGKHADFKEKSFPVYKPHCTLAYCKPEKAEPYADLYVDGSFVVSAIIISHKDHRQEIVHLGTAVQKKDPVSGRYVTPFVSFDKQGDESLRMIASLNSSRLATWGFTAEAEVLGMARYRLTAILDGRTSRFCRLINGKVFNVPDARRKVIEVLEVQDPNDLRVVQPWPKQTKAALAEFAQMSAEELTERGLHIPPYHPHCRTILRAIQFSAGESTEVTPTVPAEAEAFHAVTADDLKELGIDATPEQVDQWNEHVGMTPVELLSKFSGLPPQEVMTKGQGVGANPIRFEESGNIGFNVRGSSPQGIEFKLGALLDPFTGTYYLTRADLEAGNPKGELAFMKQMFSALIDMGLKSTATEVAVGVAGNAAYYARLGFLPDELEWDSLRTHALTIAEPMLASLQPGDRLLVEHLLQDRSVDALSALVELPFTYEGVTIGEWLFGDAVGTWGLDLTDDLLVAQAKGYLV